jgi:hypothetical protein
MTEAENILVDIALTNIKVGQSFRIQGPLTNASIGVYDKYSADIAKEITAILTLSPDKIRNILLEEEYTKCIEPSTHLDILEPKGKKAKELGGHLKYKEWELKESKRKNVEDFPKKKWYIYEPIRIVVAVLITAPITFGVGYWLGQKQAPKNTTTTHQSIRVTSPKDTAQSKPKTLSKNDSL